MTERPRILVVEDEYLIAFDLARDLEMLGAEVVGPTPSVERALELVRAEPQLDGAVLDINLGGEMVYPVADVLREKNVPIIFTTGYDEGMIPARFGAIVRCEKPVTPPRLKSAVEAAFELKT